MSRIYKIFLDIVRVREARQYAGADWPEGKCKYRVTYCFWLGLLSSR